MRLGLIDCHGRRRRIVPKTGTPLSTPHHQATKHPKPGKPADLLSRPPDARVSRLPGTTTTPSLITPSNSSCSPGPGDSFHSSPLDCPPGYLYAAHCFRQRESRQLWAFRSKHSSQESRVPRPPSQQDRHKLWTVNLRPAGFLLGVLGLGRLSRLFSRPAQIDWLSDHLAWPATV